MTDFFDEITHFLGLFDDDPQCEEIKVDGEECCVSVFCSNLDEDLYSDDEFEQSEFRPHLEKRLDDEHHHRESDNLEILQVTSSSVQVQFPAITGGNLMYIEEKLYAKDSNDDLPWENAIILEGNEIFTLTGLKPSTAYRLRWQAPNKQFPDLMVSTKTQDEKKPKAIVTSFDFHSVTIAFDHFAPQGYQHGYFAMYKPAQGGRWTTVQQSPEDHASTSSDLPSITINGLLPRTKYMASVAIYSDYESRSHGKSTGIIEFETASKSLCFDF